MSFRDRLRSLLDRSKGTATGDRFAQAPTGASNDDRGAAGGPKVPRRIHLGVDWGTSWSKIVFRDYQALGGDRSIVVRHSDALPERDYRVPSLIVEAGGLLSFGWIAARYASV